MDQSFMADCSDIKYKMKDSSILKLNESSILSNNPHLKNMNYSSEIRMEESILNKLIPEHFLASMKEEDLQNFNTLTEKEKKMQLMMMRRKSSKSFSQHRFQKSPQSVESKKQISQTTIVYQPNILTIVGGNKPMPSSPNQNSQQ